MPVQNTLSVVLAAGKGTRMQSDLPKPLHKIAGRTLLGHAMQVVINTGHQQIAVVIGPDMDDVRDECLKHSAGAQTYVQKQQAGTADAVLAARDVLQVHSGDVMLARPDKLTSHLPLSLILTSGDSLDSGPDSSK